ncbi:hypothetical protein ACP4OV_008594 [Aristida adscensionis]
MATAARSPSPGPARPCCGGGGVRRSADSNPFRPAISPPGSPQRSSSVCKTGGGGGGGGRASPRAWCAEKENDHHQQGGDPAARPCKPAPRLSAPGGGGGKSFMAPTISAASKAVAPSASPRKRILGERNTGHVLPSPADLAHSKPRVAPPPANADLGVALDVAASLAPAAASRVASHQFGAEAEEPAAASRVAPHQFGAEAEEGRVEAAAPYDPKKNYLSPRPRFLHYKPNPRVELYRRGARRLEYNFPSESSDDATTTEDEDLTEEEEQEQPPQSAPISPLSSPAARAPTPEPRATSPRSGVRAPEPEPAASPARSRPKKKKSPLRFLLAPLALVLFMAAALVCVPPPPGSPVMLNTSLSKVSEFISVQEFQPVELAAWLNQWSSSSLDLVTTYWEALASSAQGQEFYGPQFAANLSAAAVDADPAVGFYCSAVETSPTPSEQEAVSATVLEQDLKFVQAGVPARNTEVIAESEVEEKAKAGEAAVAEEPSNDAEIDQEASGPSVIETANEFDDAPVVVEEEINAEMPEEVPGSSEPEMASFGQNLDIPSQSASEHENVEGMDESSLLQDVQSDESEGDRADGMEDQEAHLDHKLGWNMLQGYLDKVSNPAAVGTALAVIIVSAALAFLYIKQKRAMNSNQPSEQDLQVENQPGIAEPAEQVTTQSGFAEPAEQVGTQSDSGSSEGHFMVQETQRFQDSSASQGHAYSQSEYPMVQQTERLGDSGASEYSSSLSTGHGRRRKPKEEESLSLEPKSRRDSGGQSSSYGSFTTYEKIPAKKKNKDDEVMTPVRRSSRLRNVKTPET